MPPRFWRDPLRCLLPYRLQQLFRLLVFSLASLLPPSRSLCEHRLMLEQWLPPRTQHTRDRHSSMPSQQLRGGIRRPQHEELAEALSIPKLAQESGTLASLALCLCLSSQSSVSRACIPPLPPTVEYCWHSSCSSAFHHNMHLPHRCVCSHRTQNQTSPDVRNSQHPYHFLSLMD